jgi:hypothetical protein
MNSTAGFMPVGMSVVPACSRGQTHRPHIAVRRQPEHVD